MTRAVCNSQDERACYRKLLELLHPDGLTCPRCGSRQFNQVTCDYTTSVPAYRCCDCTRCFDAWTGTLLQGACCPASEVYHELLLVLDRVARRGFLNSGPIRPDAGRGPLGGLIPSVFLRAKAPGAEPGVEVT